MTACTVTCWDCSDPPQVWHHLCVECAQDHIDRHRGDEDGTVITVDEKVRRENYPDILIEHWSDDKKLIPGWGHRDKHLTCDYIAYALIPSQTCYLLPYQVLRRAIKLHGETWWEKSKRNEPGYRLVPAKNGTYQTLSYVVPTEVLLNAIRDCLVVRWERSTG